jgi:glycosyltransferase involved in cell wall biosynthesis
MCRGVPVIATDVGGLREIITNELTGLLVPLQTEQEAPGPDIQNLADTQLRLVNEPAWARCLAEAGRRSVAERFTPEEMITQTVKCYTEASSLKNGAACAVAAGG